jgi:hypothetical protein
MFGLSPAKVLYCINAIVTANAEVDRAKDQIYVAKDENDVTLQSSRGIQCVCVYFSVCIFHLLKSDLHEKGLLPTRQERVVPHNPEPVRQDETTLCQL